MGGLCSMVHLHVFQLRYSQLNILVGKLGVADFFACPPRSPDFYLMDFLFRGHLKSLVYETPMSTGEGTSSLQLTSPAHWIFLNASDNPSSKILKIEKVKTLNFEQFL
ncbi:hypothetical protein TNCV_2702321 [Trichonephila clavipes]|nr:hypothetical protein TNCV_2702321 [Trichonephila clavipes]